MSAWAFYITEYPDEGLVGPYDSEQEAKREAKRLMPDDDTSVCRISDEQAAALQAELEEEGVRPRDNLDALSVPVRPKEDA